MRNVIMTDKRTQRTMGAKRQWMAGALGLALLASTQMRAAAPQCERVELAGQVNAGQEWHAAIGEGWMVRLAPIERGSQDYSGWDIVVDRQPAAGYPDALLLATPPYHSISQREIGTTFGLRAQDAIGWNPRSFHFLTDPAALRAARKLFGELSPSRQGDSARQSALEGKLLALTSHASDGQLHILDARLTPGAANPEPYAQNWALNARQTPYSIESNMGNPATPRGQLYWMRFAVTLWLPRGWRTPAGLRAQRAACSE